MGFLTRRALLGALGLSVAAGGAAILRRRQRLQAAQALSLAPLGSPSDPLSVYHLGHSLVGRDMPAMLAQLAPQGHDYASQLGWGTSLREHWEPDLPINGFDAENAHPRFRPAKEALQSGGFDAVVLTEMVEIRDAIRYHDSARYLARWAGLVRAGNPAARVYLYETWHRTDDPAGWLARIDGDLASQWQDRILLPAIARSGVGIHLIPAGQVMAAFLRQVQAQGGIDGILAIEDLMARAEDGTADTIHFNDLGAYLVALTHYAVLYHRSPAGLPHELRRADGTRATAPTARTAALMQRVTWDVVRRHPETGVTA